MSLNPDPVAGALDRWRARRRSDDEAILCQLGEPPAKSRYGWPYPDLDESFSELVYREARWLAFRRAWEYDELLLQAITLQGLGWLDHLHVVESPIDLARDEQVPLAPASSLGCPPDCLGDHR